VGARKKIGKCQATRRGEINYLVYLAIGFVAIYASRFTFNLYSWNSVWTYFAKFEINHFLHPFYLFFIFIYTISLYPTPPKVKTTRRVWRKFFI